VASATLAVGDTATLVVAGTQIRFGTLPIACGAATTTNTDLILVNGAVGTVENLTIDLSGGAFAPGATAESDTAEIEMSLVLGDPTDRVTISGTAGPDTISVGMNGVAFTTDADVDMTVSPLRPVIEIFGLDGPNTLSGRGGYGAGSEYPSQLILRAGSSGDTLEGGSAADDIYGGSGNDTLVGRDGNDQMAGGGGNDSLAGNGGNDELRGDAGLDSLIGGDADDVLRADDDEADTNLNGGPGNDTAYYDLGVDPVPVAVEIKIPA